MTFHISQTIKLFKHNQTEQSHKLSTHTKLILNKLISYVKLSKESLLLKFTHITFTNKLNTIHK
jgi:hypothetical protein